MSDEIRKQLFEIPGGAFKEHLELNSNERILFSGKFGKGKTTFLKYFFENQKEFHLEKEYFTIYLSPINYSIASNEDIISYIKYDIILELLRHGIEFENFDISFKETLSYYIYKNPEKVIGKLISFIPYVGKEFDELNKKAKTLIEEVKNFKKEIEKKIETKALEDYLEEVENNGASLYENDFITKIIQKVIGNKSEGSKKETVLVIDDLDRLDPEHIFRILNVFAAHFDNQSNGVNKFGFSKLVVVCDYNNIRNIYTYRYGANVDFNGYIDKFYSNEPFIFLNNQQVSETINYYVNKIIIRYGRDQFTYGQFVKNFINKNGVDTLIKTLIKYDYISLRSLLIYTKEKYFSVSSNIKYIGQDIDLSNGCIIFEGIIVSDLAGGYASLNAILQELENKSPQIEDYSSSFKELLCFIQFPNSNNIKDEWGKSYHLDEKTHLIFDFNNGRIENLQVMADLGMKLKFNPTPINYLKLCQTFFMQLFGSNIIY